MKDYSRDKGPYAIIANKGDKSGYLVVHVIARDENGNVLRHEKTVLSYPPTVAAGQNLIDRWHNIDRSGLVQQARNVGII